MEENIKKCEKLLGKDRWVLGTEDKQAIKNLIKGYRELEESNKILQDAYWNECVSKSKIKEKIKELYEDKDSKYYDMFLEQRDIEKTISVLQELMEDK